MQMTPLHQQDCSSLQFCFLFFLHPILRSHSLKLFSWPVSAWLHAFLCMPLPHWLVGWMSRHAGVHSTHNSPDPLSHFNSCNALRNYSGLYFVRIQGIIQVSVIPIKPHSDSRRAAGAWWGIIKALQINELVVQTNHPPLVKCVAWRLSGGHKTAPCHRYWIGIVL